MQKVRQGRAPGRREKRRESRGRDGEFFCMADRIPSAGFDDFWNSEDIFRKNLTCRNLCALAGGSDPVYDTGKFYLDSVQRNKLHRKEVRCAE